MVYSPTMAATTGFDRIFGNTALERGWIGEERLSTAISTRPRGLPLADHLVSSGALTEAQRGALMALFETVLTIPGYSLLSALGRGAMGTVYKARDKEGRFVAIKVLSPSWARNPEIVKQFLNEAALIRKLEHPNIVRLIDTISDAGTYCIVMEHVEGPSLSRAVSHEAFSIGAVVGIIVQVGHALEHAHGVGIIHRDITPRNILLRSDGAPKLVDFGTAILRRGPSPENQGVTAGTPIYMSPEQAGGNLELQDGRTDIYSLGVVLYEALSGRAPFSGKSVAEILEKVRNEPPPALISIAPRLPMELVSIIETAMDKNPAHRYPTMTAFVDQLEKWGRLSTDWFSIVPAS